MTKISIIGASGFIGYRLYQYLIRFNNFEVQGTYNFKKNLYLKKVDITNHKNLQNYLLQETPDFILWLSGCKDINKCENDYNFSYGINTKPIEDLVSILYQSKISTRVLFFSTNYVFEGIEGNYQDNAKQNPRTNYGKTKTLAENILRESSLDYKIIRTSAIMGRGGTFFDWLLKAINEEKEINLYSNIYFTPTPLEFLNENIKNMIDNFDKIESKIIHLVGEKRLSKYEFAIELAKLVKQKNIKIYPQEVNLESPWIQRDLSLLQSNLVKRNQVKYFWDYIEKEVKDDTNTKR